MKLFLRKYLIRYEDIKDEITIDVRTKEQFSQNKILKNNIPIINKAQHDFLHRHLFWAEIIIIYGMLKNIKSIKKDLIEISNNKKDKLVIGCSKGRLRSPTMWIYAKILGIEAKVLEGGIVNINKDKNN
ncbi:MAG: rhodanese-like domain-containing protein [Peptostreptococcaceae bacterium]